MDARGRPGVYIPFGLDEDMLAFHVNERLGESEDPRVFARPAKSVIKVLSESTTAQELARRLPDNI